MAKSPFIFLRHTSHSDLVWQDVCTGALEKFLSEIYCGNFMPERQLQACEDYLQAFLVFLNNLFKPQLNFTY